MLGFKEFLIEAKRQKESLEGTQVTSDEYGTPLRVYHATSATQDFGLPSKTRDLGMHFAEDPKAASRALTTRVGGKTHKGGPRTIPAFLSVKNPLEMEETDKGGWDFSAVLGQLERKGILSTPAPDLELSPEEGRKKGLTPLTVRGRDLPNFGAAVKGKRKIGKIDLTAKEYLEKTIREVGNKKESPMKKNRRRLKKLVGDLQTLGYDGAYYQNKVEGGGRSWIAFTPQQIISSISGKK